MLPLPTPRTPSRVARGFLLSAGLALLVGSAGCSHRSDHLTASVERIDFGLVEHGREATQTFRVKNEGQRTVVLSAVAPSCKCLSVDPTFRRSLGPDEETDVVVRLTTAHVPAQKLEGKSIHVVSDDATMPVLVVPVFGEIVSLLTVSPELVRVGAGDAAGRGEPRRIRLRTAPGFTAELRSVENLKPDWFETKMEAVPEGIDLLLSVKPDPTRRGPVDTFVRLHVTVTGRGLPPVDYDDKRITIRGEW